MLPSPTHAEPHPSALHQPLPHPPTPHQQAVYQPAPQQAIHPPVALYVPPEPPEPPPIAPQPPRSSRAEKALKAATAVGMVFLIATLALVSHGQNQLQATPDLSAVPPTPTFEIAAAPESLAMVAVDDVSLAASTDHRRLKEHVEQWLSAHDVDGARIGFGFPDGSIAIIVAGADSDNAQLLADEPFLATSVTKTMTSAIILGLVHDGLLDLDAPTSELSVLPDFAFEGRVTVRQLLHHTAGLISYQDAASYSKGKVITPVEALALSGEAPLEWTPGSKKGYSNSGYIYLGLIAEEVTGKTFDELIEERVVASARLSDTSIDDKKRPGWVGYAAGGLVTTVADMVRWGSALYRDGVVLDPASLAAMTDVTNEFSSGLGTNPICPCGVHSDGERWYTSIGHDGGSATVQFAPANRLVVGAKFTESFWTEDLDQRDIHDLLEELRTIASESP